MPVKIQGKILLRTENVIFTVLFCLVLGLLAWLSTQYDWRFDWSASNKNSLSKSSIDLLQKIHKPIKITAYVNNNKSLRAQIKEVVDRYKKIKQNIDYTFVDPELNPKKIRKLSISINGELIVDIAGRTEHVKQLSEQALTNAILRAAREENPWVVFLEGHGERKPYGTANHDFKFWADELIDKGFNIRGVNLVDSLSIPRNTAILVLASPQTKLLAGELALIKQYIKEGGNFLWFAEPDSMQGMNDIADQLGLVFLPGVIVDPSAKLLSKEDPRFALVTHYPSHPATQQLNIVTLFPQAVGIKVNKKAGIGVGWNSSILLETSDQAWSETGTTNDNEFDYDITYEQGIDYPGPIIIGLSLTRKVAFTQPIEKNSQIVVTTEKANQQRVVVMGDGDFLSNTYLGNGANLDLGLHILNWLAQDDHLISIAAKPALDLNLDLSRTAIIMIGFGFLVIFPIAMVSTGVSIWAVRRKK